MNISMTQCGDPLHNALAERMNNTIKNGWLFDCDDESFEQVSKRIEDAVYVYNHVRPHQGINMRTPMEVVSETGGLTA
ncbi:integrase core domain-containing protein [Bacteroides thetaiotaomicron]|uniref:integrase core domain-containing protein n=1 Tax=Bacteroides thetaiotaomicron TaxID=818 RepID=UPI003519F828